MKHVLTRIVNWGQELLGEVVQPGDLAIDLTAGNGQDTTALFQMVGETGQVIAFDVQSQALLTTHNRLVDAGAQVRSIQRDNCPLQRQSGIDLMEMSHDEVAGVVTSAPMGVIANLGYLPGGQRDVMTRPESSVAALEQSCSLLAEGGRLAVVVYPGHPGGAQEAAAVSDFFNNLDDTIFYVLLMKVSNRSQAPFLFVAEKMI